MALKRDELADPNSCLNRADSAEPIFVLRGSDPLTPKLIEDWAARAVLASVHEFEKCKAAVRFAAYVRAWQREHRPSSPPATTTQEPAGDLESSDKT